MLSSIARFRLGASLLCLIASLVLLTGAGTLHFADRLELLAYDLRMTRFSAPAELDERIVIIDIDERSLAIEGQWPWPRNRIAELVYILKEDYQAGTIGLDILFPEASRYPQHDQQLNTTLSASHAVMAQVFQLENSSRQLQTGVLVADETTPAHPQAPTAKGYIGNNSVLATRANAGHIAVDVDMDGKVRRLPPIVNWQQHAFSSLPLTLVTELFQLRSFQLNQNSSLFQSALAADNPPFMVPLDHNSRMLIPFRGDAGLYMYIPATDILNHEVDPTLLQGRIALIGSSATGLFDLIATPWSKHYPGVEVHANILTALLDNTLISEPQGTLPIMLALCIALFTATMLGYSRLSITLSTLIPAALAILWLGCNILLWQHQIALPVTQPLLLLLALVLVNSPALALQATQQRQTLYRHFQDYVPATVVEKLLKDHQHHGIQPERREMTVLFMDIRGFTSIAEKLTPTQLSRLMNEVLSPVTRIIHEQEGTIDKYMGDAVMAFWGAPLRQPDHAERAVRTALRLQEAIEALNIRLQAQQLPSVRVGIGINTGHMTVGNMGSDFRVSYTVIGDAVNIAARLESLTKDYTPDILIGGSTANALPDNIQCEYMGQSAIKGRSQPIQIYSPT